MKRIFFHFILALITASSVFAQAPKKMSYQAVIKNSSNAILASRTVSIRISILQGSMSGTSVYTETQSPTTNVNGLVSIEIGTGTVLSGSFANINWGTGPYYIKTEIDPLGGTEYLISGTSQLVSVPYALYAETSGSFPKGTNYGDMQYWNGTAWTTIPIGQPSQILQLNEYKVPTWNGSISSPTLNTTSISSITSATAISGGAIYDAGGLGISITSRGICWSTSSNPTILNSKTNDGTGNGSFTSIISGLTTGTTYYVRAYAVNSAGLVSYGQQESFTTPILAILSTTATATNITDMNATCGGSITSDGGAPIIERGLCWSTASGPTIQNSKVVSGAGTGSFSGILTYLTANTVYYVRAYATSAAGTSYGNEITVRTFATLTLGQFFQGGIIYYFLQPGDLGYVAGTKKGLIAAQMDLNTSLPGGPWWHKDKTPALIGTSTVIGSGRSNCELIHDMEGHGKFQCPYCQGCAFLLCKEWTVNSYSDWYLPSLDELAKLYERKGYLSTSPKVYWSSSEATLNNKHAINFSNGSKTTATSNNFLFGSTN